MQWKDISYMLTGFSTGIFGISWNPPPNVREIIRGLVIALEDRRCLYNKYVEEDKEAVRVSVDQIRADLTRVAQSIPERSETLPLIQEMRAACRKYMDDAYEPVNRSYDTTPTYQFFQALGALRAGLGERLHRLCLMYGIDVNDELANSVFPYVDDPKQATTARQQGA